jgi:small nuclear ribonucleoprotein (snRNP)-like protein
MEEKLKELLGTPVKIERKDNSGKIIITFYSPEEIEGIIQKLDSQTNL